MQNITHKTIGHNMHTHSTWSDGKISPELQIDRAVEEGLKVYGISDHLFATKFNPGYEHRQVISPSQYDTSWVKRIDSDNQLLPCNYPSVMPEKVQQLKEEEDYAKQYVDSQVPDKIFTAMNGERYVMIQKDVRPLLNYINKLNELKGEASKKGLKLLAGGEMGEYDYEKLPYDTLNQLDYLLFEIDSSSLLESLINVRDKFTIPVGLAHVDLQKICDQTYFRKESRLAKKLSENDIFIDLSDSEPSPERPAGRNTRNDGRGYFSHFTHKLIKKLKKYKVKFVAGTDTHKGNWIVPYSALLFMEQNQLESLDLVKGN